MKKICYIVVGLIIGAFLSVAFAQTDLGEEWELLFSVYRHRETGEIRLVGIPDSLPTLTPSPTPISTETFPTPTPESTVPAVTPRPTNPPPDELVCMAGVKAARLNVRTAPNTSATAIRQLSAGDKVRVNKLYIAYPEGSPRREEWGELEGGGWIALWYNGSQLAVLDDTQGCWEIEIEYAASFPVSGFHILPGDGSWQVVPYAQQIDVIKCVNDTWGICDQVKSRNPNVITIARTLYTSYGLLDCPQDWNWENPNVWWDAIKNALPEGYDYYEVLNECGPPPQGYAYWAGWSIEMAKLVQRDKGGALLAFSFAAGNPSYSAWPELLSYLVWANNNPLPDGRRHGIALHAAAYAPWSRADSPWVNNPHLTADRYFVLVRDIILANTGQDILKLRIPVIYTELGLSDGYSGNWNAQYSCEEKASAYKETARKLLPKAKFTWWNIGKVWQWTDDSPCLAQMLGG